MTKIKSKMAENQGNANKNKRIIDPDSEREEPPAKRQKIVLNLERKKKMLKAILTAAKYIYEKIDCTTKSALNINLNCQIANVLFTCHNIQRQKAQEPGKKGNMDTKTEGKAFKFTIGGKGFTVAKDVAMTEVAKAFKENGFEYKKFSTEDPDNWYGMAGPYIDFFVGFDYRLQELRMGHGEMSIRKEADGKETKFMVSKYGILPNHHILLEGIGFPPEKRASMAQSMGPLTALLCYLRTGDPHRQKWKNACLRSMGHIPYIKDLLEVFANTKSAHDCCTVITLLADTLLIAGTRNAHRVFFPILLFYLSVHSSPADGITFGTLEPDILGKVDFSGKGAFMVYKNMCNLTGITMYANTDDAKAQQIIYHAMFGTFKEDLNLLAEITTCGTWNTRSELGKCFAGMGSSERQLNITLIRQRYWSKLASANISGLLSATYTQLSFAGVYSGKRTQNFSKEFFDSIGRGMGPSVGVRSLEDLQKVAQKTLREVVNQLKKGGNKLTIGTVEWYAVDKLTWDARGDAVKFKEPENHKYFLGAPTQNKEEDD